MSLPVVIGNHWWQATRYNSYKNIPLVDAKCKAFSTSTEKVVYKIR